MKSKMDEPKSEEPVLSDLERYLTRDLRFAAVCYRALHRGIRVDITPYLDTDYTTFVDRNDDQLEWVIDEAVRRKRPIRYIEVLPCGALLHLGTAPSYAPTVFRRVEWAKADPIPTRRSQRSATTATTAGTGASMLTRNRAALAAPQPAYTRLISGKHEPMNKDHDGP